MRIITCSAACYCASPSWTWDYLPLCYGQ